MRGMLGMIRIGYGLVNNGLSMALVLPAHCLRMALAPGSVQGVSRQSVRSIQASMLLPGGDGMVAEG